MTALLLVLAVHAYRRRRFLMQLQASACALCGSPFEDTIAEYLGSVRAPDRRHLDGFQRRFACHKVQCGDCGAVNICTRDGIAFAARVPREV